MPLSKQRNRERMQGIRLHAGVRNTCFLCKHSKLYRDGGLRCEADIVMGRLVQPNGICERFEGR